MNEPTLKTIDAEPRQHSHLYELRPMSRWWLVPICGYAALYIAVMGVATWQAWAGLLAGAGLGLAAIMIFPRFWLSKTTD